MEEYLRRTLTLSRGDALVSFDRPVSTVLFIVAVTILAAVLLSSLQRSRDAVFMEA